MLLISISLQKSLAAGDEVTKIIHSERTLEMCGQKPIRHQGNCLLPSLIPKPKTPKMLMTLAFLTGRERPEGSHLLGPVYNLMCALQHRPLKSARNPVA